MLLSINIMDRLEERIVEMNNTIKEIEFLVNYYQTNFNEFEDYNYIYDLENSVKRFIYLYNQH